MNVLVYADPDVLHTLLSDTLTVLRSVLNPHYCVQKVSSESLGSHPWTATCALLVILAGSHGNLSLSSALSAVSNYVKSGGAFLAFGADERSSSGDTLETILADKLVGVNRDSKNVKIFATYPGTDDENEVECALGKGGANLKRRRIFQDILVDIGLHLPSPEEENTTRPLPQFLVSSSTHLRTVSRILDALHLGIPSPESQLSVFEDSNDVFHFHSMTQASSILQDARSTSNKASYHDLVREPKHIVVCPDGQLPEAQQTPLFDIALYFDTLRAAKKTDGCTVDDDAFGFGESILYGEVVTSTQTMLDKNPRLLSLLPVPILSIASYQLAGRGRGSNVWVSPSGSLLMSLSLRISLSRLPAQKLVFVQYLFALAVVEACREDTVLGKCGQRVKLKWPNDLYVVSGDGYGERRKIGGVLVTTSFTGGNVEMVIGCGINVACHPPLASLSQLLPPGTPTSSHPRPERTAATVMSKFESMWYTFISHNGSFDPFMDLYLDRWIHTNEVVTLTTVTPPMRVRILGITMNHGLLRTVPENAGWCVEEKDYVDLQPDGNSFDIMAGMIKAKT